jgi:general secretion pathway protein G
MKTKIIKQKNLNSKSKGFTLIELLVVIVILGILAAIGLRSFRSTQIKSRDARRKEDLSSVARALEAYYNDQGQYPEGGAVTGQILGCAGVGETPVACDWGGTFQDYLGTFYMAQLPEDPSSYSYFYVSSGSDYKFYARLENTQDQSIARDEEGDPAGYTDISCGALLCNYGITSSNSSLPTIVTPDEVEEE